MKATSKMREKVRLGKAKSQDKSNYFKIVNPN